MKNPRDVMPLPTAAIFEALQAIPSLKSFVLVGGTGLSLHLGHRKSEDLDFITTSQRLSRSALRLTEEALRQSGHSVCLSNDPAAAADFETAGIDLSDYTQDWTIDESVKVTFFAGDEPQNRILTALPAAQNQTSFRVGTLEEISQLKALVTSTRSKSRDWLDLFILDRDHGFGLPQWKAAFETAGLTAAHFESALDRVCSGRVTPEDEGFEMLMERPPNLESITLHFRNIRKNYEKECAEAASLPALTRLMSGDQSPPLRDPAPDITPKKGKE